MKKLLNRIKKVYLWVKYKIKGKMPINELTLTELTGYLKKIFSANIGIIRVAENIVTINAIVDKIYYDLTLQTGGIITIYFHHIDGQVYLKVNFVSSVNMSPDLLSVNLLNIQMAYNNSPSKLMIDQCINLLIP